MRQPLQDLGLRLRSRPALTARGAARKFRINFERLGMWHSWTKWASKGRQDRRRILFAGAGVAAVCVAAIIVWRYEISKTDQIPLPAPVPVSVAEAQKSDVPIYYDALGTVSALNT